VSHEQPPDAGCWDRAVGAGLLLQPCHPLLAPSLSCGRAGVVPECKHQPSIALKLRPVPVESRLRHKCPETVQACGEAGGEKGWAVSELLLLIG